MLGIGAIPSVLLGVSMLAMPESPWWLVMQGRLGDAKRELDKTSDSLKETEDRLAKIKATAGIPENCRVDVIQVPKSSSHGEGVWRDLLVTPTPSVRRVLVAAIGMHFFQQASGIDAVVLYCPRIFKKARIKRDNVLLATTVAVGFTKTIFILVATFFLDKVGRRPLLLTSTAVMILSHTGLGFGLTIVDQHPEKKLLWALAMSIARVLSLLASFSLGLGPIAWVYSSEIFPLRLRAQGASMGVATNRVVSGVISMTFITLQRHYYRGQLLLVPRRCDRGVDLFLHVLAGDEAEASKTWMSCFRILGQKPEGREQEGRRDQLLNYQRVLQQGVRDEGIVVISCSSVSQVWVDTYSRLGRH